MGINNRKNYLRVSLLAAPLQAMVTTTPIFAILDNDIRILPFVWIMISIPILGLWMLNYQLQSKINNNWKHYIISFALVISLSIVIRHFFIDEFKLWLNGLGFGVLKRTPPLITTTTVAVMNNAMVIVFQRLIKYREEQIKIVGDLAEVQLLRANEQYRHLKNQVHPHFLFNSLNTLKILVKKDPEMAENYIMKLSNFLRVAVQENQDELISLNKDIHLAIDYLTIQQMRFKDSIVLVNEINEEQSEMLKMPILTVQSFFENAIKHNAISNEFPLQIFLGMEDGALVVRNSIRKKVLQEDFSSGVGLKYLAERLQMLQVGALTIEETDSEFLVKVIFKK
ncbi:MAG: histidine kinase [Flavobacteriales bacterium]